MTTPRPTPVLLVDDQPANLTSLEAILDGPDYHLVKAVSGKDALRQLLAREFALILLDVRMPEMDGYEVCRQFKANAMLRDIPILFLSALTGSDEKVELAQNLPRPVGRLRIRPGGCLLELADGDIATLPEGL